MKNKNRFLRMSQKRLSQKCVFMDIANQYDCNSDT